MKYQKNINIVERLFDNLERLKSSNFIKSLRFRNQKRRRSENKVKKIEEVENQDDSKEKDQIKNPSPSSDQKKSKITNIFNTSRKNASAHFLTSSLTNFQQIQEEKQTHFNMINSLQRQRGVKIIVAGKPYEHGSIQTISEKEAPRMAHDRIKRRSASSRVHNYEAPQMNIVMHEVSPKDGPGPSTINTKDSVPNLKPNYQTNDFAQALKSGVLQSSFSSSRTNRAANTSRSTNGNEIMIKTRPVIK